MKFDFILSNITRNILSQGLEELADHLTIGGSIAISGFLTEDLEYMLQRLEQCKLHFKQKNQKKDWVCLIAEKQ